MRMAILLRGGDHVNVPQTERDWLTSWSQSPTPVNYYWRTVPDPLQSLGEANPFS
jgi:hypothetical protein